MLDDSFDHFVASVRSDWGPITTKLVSQCRAQLGALMSSPDTEQWLAELLAERPATRELHSEPNSFMLLAHAEHEGLYRPPHDHGRAWVLYGVQSGALEVCTYARIFDERGDRLVRREAHILSSGEARAYLPGDIHDTRCLTDQALVFRFTERDLKLEDEVERRLTRFVGSDDEWFAPGS